MEIVISSKPPKFGIDLSELWRYRELFWSLAWRSILVRYKQTVVGVAWALIRPVLTMIVFSVIFGRIAGFPFLQMVEKKLAWITANADKLAGVLG